MESSKIFFADNFETPVAEKKQKLEDVSNGCDDQKENTPTPSIPSFRCTCYRSGQNCHAFGSMDVQVSQYFTATLSFINHSFLITYLTYINKIKKYKFSNLHSIALGCCRWSYSRSIPVESADEKFRFGHRGQRGH